MKKIEEKVFRFIDRHNLIEKKDNVLISLSGGPDSVFLIYFLSKFRKRFDIRIGAFHLNHMLRGAESDADEKFCARLADKLGLDFYCTKRDILSEAKKNKISVEEAGRLVRYSELEEIALENHFNKIATAHNCDDNSETVLLNFIKGSGLSGISGIPARRGNIIRPVLCLDKSEILSYLKISKINFRLDSSNLSSDFERNFLRNKIIPLLEENLNPNFSQTVFRNSENFRNLLSGIEETLERFVSGFVRKHQTEIEISKDAFLKLPEGFYGIFIKTILEKYLNIQASFVDVNKVISLIDKTAGLKVEISGGHNVHNERNSLTIKKPLNSKDEIVKIKVGSEVVIPAGKLKIENVSASKIALTNKKNIEYISADTIEGDFELRCWRKGDKFIPLGMNHSKKVSDFLTDQKIKPSEKKFRQVLLNNQKIVWVIGERIDERFKVNKNSKRILKITLN
jgi:tRNA(Ile)-lysidine synthase